MDMKTWMNTLRDEKQLCQITMPGSHDAGVYAEDAKSVGLGAKSSAVCQDKTLGEQCEAGSRFFDLRIITAGGEQVAHHTKKVLGQRHGVIGGELAKMMGQLAGFVSAHQREFVIARFTKCKQHADVVATVKAAVGDKLYKGKHCLARQEIGSLRGKVIAVFGDDFADELIDPAAGIHKFIRYEGQEHHHGGLTTCGKYADSMDIFEVWADQLEKLQEHDRHASHDNHICVVYMTMTSGVKNIKKFTEGKKGAHESTAYAFPTVFERRARRKNSGLLPPQPANVVMYDFVNPKTSEEIVGLNFPPYALS
jgi:hypothetical protein